MSVQFVERLLIVDPIPVGLEAEIRLGMVHISTTASGQTKRTFEPGVTKLQFDAVLTKLASSDSWESVSDWKEYEDRFFVHPVNGKKLRATVSYNAETGAEEVLVVEKKQIKHVIATVPFNTLLASTTPKTGIKMALAEEIILGKDEMDALPAHIVPNHVRIKHRKSFLHASSTIPGVKFQFDLTRVWQGATFEEAEMKQRMSVDTSDSSAGFTSEHQQATTYEIEVEVKGEPLKNRLELFAALFSLLHKASDLVRMAGLKSFHIDQFMFL